MKGKKLIFQDIPEQYKSAYTSIQDELIRSIFSNFKFKYFNFSSNFANIFNQDTAEQIINILKDYRFIVYQITATSKSSTPENANTEVNQDDLNQQNVDVAICIENTCFILESIQQDFIHQIFTKIESSIINISPKNRYLASRKGDSFAIEEVKNMLSKYKIIKNNSFVKKTIYPMAAYLIRRYFYPSHFFKNRSFFTFDKQNTTFENFFKNLFTDLIDIKEKEKLEKQYKIISQKIIDRNNIVNEEKMPIYDFKMEDFIPLRCLSSNRKRTIYLVIHISTLYVFVMKKTNQLEQHEIDFVMNYSHKTMTRFYGFVKNGKSVYGLIYEFMSNGSLNDFVCENTKEISPLFSYKTVIRVFECIQFLHSHSLIHRDLSPSNILIDHDYQLFVSDFETIRKIDGDLFTQDIGFVYASPEQIYGSKISFSTDIYSFGLLIYFVFEKKCMFSDLNTATIMDLKSKYYFKKLTNCLDSFQNIYQECLKFNQDERPTRSTIMNYVLEYKNFASFFFQYINENDIETFHIDEIIYYFLSFIELGFNIFKVNESISYLQYLFIFLTVYLLLQKDSFSSDYDFKFLQYENESHIPFLNEALKLVQLYAGKNNIYALFLLGNIYSEGKLLRTYYARAKKIYELAAKKNHIGSILKLANLYKLGKVDNKKDLLKAIEYFELAASLNSSDAFVQLGNMYHHPDGIEINYIKAKEYYEQAARRKNKFGFFMLGKLYYKGHGVRKDYVRARILFEKAVKYNHLGALIFLGDIYYNGLGVKVDIQKAKYYYELSAQQDDPRGYLYLGIIYLNQKDYQKAKDYLQMASNQGEAEAFYYIGYLYFYGYGVTKDLIRARYYFETALYDDEPLSSCMLGKMYMFGIGVKIDYKKAKKYFKTAFNVKPNDSGHYLGDIYYYGKGVKQNFIKAKMYYEKAIEYGCHLSYEQLGDMYFYGEGVEQNYYKAIQCYDFKRELYYYPIFYRLGIFYSNQRGRGNNLSKAVHYYDVAFKLYQKMSRKSQIRENSYFYLICNNLGLIYMTEYNNYQYAINYIKIAALNEYPYGQNNYGILCQFYLNDIEKAQYMYERSANNHFALAEYNLGCILEKKGQNNASIEYFIRAVEDEDEPFIFRNIHVKDERLKLSTTFVICLTNLKLVIYYLNKENYAQGREHFIKAFSKLIKKNKQFFLKNISNVDFNNQIKIYSFLLQLIFTFPDFSFSFVKNESYHQKEKQIPDKIKIDQSPLNIPEDEEKINSIFNKIDEVKYEMKKLEYSKIDEEKNSSTTDESSGTSESSESESETSESYEIKDNIADLYDVAVQTPKYLQIFINIINKLIEEMNKVLYIPPYCILFGRIIIGDEYERMKKIRINKLFYEGFDLNI